MKFENKHRDIIELCKAGDRKAQFRLYQLYSKAMYNTCLRMVQNEADAEDLLQSSFVDVFTRLDTFKYQAAIGAWIKRIVINNCINFLKKRKMRFEELNEGIFQLKEEQTEPVYYDVAAIKAAIANLPTGYRTVFSLYMLEGYDHKEIGEVLGISEATSKSQYSRAKMKLRQLVTGKK